MPIRVIDSVKAARQGLKTVAAYNLTPLRLYDDADIDVLLAQADG